MIPSSELPKGPSTSGWAVHTVQMFMNTCSLLTVPCAWYRVHGTVRGTRIWPRWKENTAWAVNDEHRLPEALAAHRALLFANSGPVRTDALRSVAACDTLLANSGTVRTDALRSVAACGGYFASLHHASSSSIYAPGWKVPSWKLSPWKLLPKGGGNSFCLNRVHL